MDGHQRAVRVLVEHAAQVFQPQDHFRGVAYQRLDQFGIVGEMAASHDVQVVLAGRVVLLVGCLDAALRHHRIGIAVAQLGDHQDPGTLLATPAARPPSPHHLRR